MMNTYLHRILFIIFFIALHKGFAVNYTWVGTVDNSWTNAANWRISGNSSASIPGPYDVAYFQASATRDCYVTQTIIVGGIYIDYGFSHKIIQSDSKHMYIGTNGIFQNTQVPGSTEFIQFGNADVKVWGEVIYEDPGYFDTRESNFLQYPPESFESYVCLFASFSSSENKNYVRTYTPVQAFSLESDLYYSVKNEAIQTKDYYDGYGRPVQKVLVQG